MLDKNDLKKIELLRAKRRELVSSRERSLLRKENGPRIVKKINNYMCVNYKVADFVLNKKPKIDFSWKPDFKDCDGLVLAHVSKEIIINTLRCCAPVLGRMEGMIGFDEHEYLGLAKVNLLNIYSLIGMAESLGCAVLFYPEDHLGVILVDYFERYNCQEPEEYSLVIQGRYIEQKLASCF